VWRFNTAVEDNYLCGDNTAEYLPKASKYLYIRLNISIFLPIASNSLYISVTIDFQISIGKPCPIPFSNS
jgi:hypothetical protein